MPFVVTQVLPLLHLFPVTFYSGSSSLIHCSSYAAYSEFVQCRSAVEPGGALIGGGLCGEIVSYDCERLGALFRLFPGLYRLVLVQPLSYDCAPLFQNKCRSCHFGLKRVGRVLSRLRRC